MVVSQPPRANWEEITSKEENQCPVNYTAWSSTARSKRETLRITIKRSFRDGWALSHSMQESLPFPLSLLRYSQKWGAWVPGA